MKGKMPPKKMPKGTHKMPNGMPMKDSMMGKKKMPAKRRKGY